MTVTSGIVIVQEGKYGPGPGRSLHAPSVSLFIVPIDLISFLKYFHLLIHISKLS